MADMKAMKYTTTMLLVLLAWGGLMPASASRHIEQADLHFETPPIYNTVVLEMERPECPAGQKFHAPFNRCTPPVRLRTNFSTLDEKLIFCPATGGTEYWMLEERTVVRGWISNPPEEIIYDITTTPATWNPVGGFSECPPPSDPTPPPEPPPTPPAEPAPPTQPAKGSGVTRSITMTGRLVCGPESPYWNSVSLGMYLPAGGKEAIVNAYKSHPMQVGRCPESGDGWEYWQNRMLHADFQFEGQEKLTISSVRREIHAVSTSLSLQRTIADNSCIAAANATYGAGKYTKATFNTGSGNKCTVIF